MTGSSYTLSIEGQPSLAGPDPHGREGLVKHRLYIYAEKRGWATYVYSDVTYTDEKM